MVVAVVVVVVAVVFMVVVMHVGVGIVAYDIQNRSIPEPTQRPFGCPTYPACLVVSLLES